MTTPSLPANTCPRRVEDWGGGAETGQDVMDPRDSCCTYCGSLDPDVLMARLEAGDVEVGPTDKNYKAYIRNMGGPSFRQAYRTGDDNSDTPNLEKTDWVVRDIDQTKFYFQHLSDAQMNRFVQIYNAKTMKLGYPGHFYQWPFFMRPVQPKASNP